MFPEYIEWIEPMVDDEKNRAVHMRLHRAVAIDVMRSRVPALTDQEALDSFMSLHWAYPSPRHYPAPLLGSRWKDPGFVPTDADKAAHCSHVLTVNGDTIQCVNCPAHWKNEGF